MTTLNDSLVRYSGLGASPYWTFRHPTVRDAVAEVIATSPDLVQIYLSGVPIDRIAQEVVCGDIQLQGARIRVPRAEYETLVSRVARLPVAEAAAFIATRADADFIELTFARYPHLFDSELSSYRGTAFSAVAAAFHRARELGALDEVHRSQIATKIVRLATDEDEPDIGILVDYKYRGLLEVVEIKEIEEFLRSDYLLRLDNVIDNLRENWEDHEDPDDYFSEFIENLEYLPSAVALTTSEEALFKKALMYADDELDEMRQQYAPKESDDRDYDDLYDRDRDFRGGGYPATGGIVEFPRDMFDDIAD